MRNPIHWIYLSAHFDDVVLSCGGTIWEQVQAGNIVEIWTVCAGLPPEYPPNGSDAEMDQRRQVGVSTVNLRRKEDIAACRRLGAAHRYFDIPDVIYRKFPGTNEVVIHESADLWQPLLPQETYLVDEMTQLLKRLIPKGSRLAAPITFGNHMDHHLVRHTAERVATSRHPGMLYYYADFPYIRYDLDGLRAWDVSHPGTRRDIKLSPAAVQAWSDAIACYTSQIGGFWPDRPAQDEEIQAYGHKMGGHSLWKVKLSNSTCKSD